jgi:hypothetical protein
MTQGLSAVRLERMHTVLGGYIDRGEMPGLVTLVSRGEDVEVRFRSAARRRIVTQSSASGR